MKKAKVSTPHALFGQTVLAASLALAFGSAFAEEGAWSPEQIRRDMYTPDSRVSIGLGYVSGDGRRFGQYRSLSNEGAYGLLDLDFIKRDDATGTWLKLRGRNLGLDARDLRFDHERQGDWSYSLQSVRMQRDEPLIVNTGLQGIGTANQTVSAAANKRDVDLKSSHDIYVLGARKFVAGGFDVRVNFRQDENKGERMYGRGTTNLIEFLTEPLDRVTRQWEVVAGYADRKMQFSGGYNGSSYDNNVPVLNARGGNTTAFAFGPLWAMAMPPSNSAHKLHLSGGYNWTSDARTTFKLSRSVAEQNEIFDPTFARLAGSPESLNGKLVTTLAFGDLHLRMSDRLDLSGTVRFENRDDQTPQARYLAAQTPSPGTGGFPFSTAGVTGFNKPRSLKQVKGTIEAAYQLDDGYRVTGTIENEDMKRNAPLQYRRVGYRENADELIGRVELKRTMSETLNGGVALIHSARSGSDYIGDTYDPTALTNKVNTLLWADRSRNKLRVSADWLPLEDWSVQFLADVSKDVYSGRELGPREGTAQYFSGDANYKINDQWSLGTWVSRENQQSKQSTRSDLVAVINVPGYNTVWGADLRDTSTAFGINLKGKPLSYLEVGADLSASHDVAQSNLVGIAGAGVAAVNSLPEYFYRQTSLKLFADYALERKSGIRVDLVIDRRTTNDFTWSGWTYNGAPAIAAAARTSDGTTVFNPASENTTFLGVSYYYRWR